MQCGLHVPVGDIEAKGRQTEVTVHYLVVRFEIISLLDTVGRCLRERGEPTGCESTHVALRPRGLTLIIPLRNSMKVPLRNGINTGLGVNVWKCEHTA